MPLFLGQDEKTKVSLHLERFNEKYNLLHIGISFSRNNKNLRYDFRPHCEKTGYLTTNMDRQDGKMELIDMIWMTIDATSLQEDSIHCSKSSVWQSFVSRTGSEFACNYIIEWQNDFMEVKYIHGNIACLL